MTTENPVLASALLMCAGYGTRLQPLTQDLIPKHLYPIAGIPLVERSLQPFIEAQINHIYLLLSHKARMIVNHFAGDSRIKTFTVDKPDGVISEIAQFVNSVNLPGNLIVAEGDSIRNRLDIRKALKQHEVTNAHTTLLATDIPLRSPCSYHGVFVDSDAKVSGIHEPGDPAKNPNPMLGLGIFSQAAVNAICNSPDQSGSWSSFLPHLFKLGKVYASIQPVDYFNINTPEAVQDSEDFFRQQ